MKTKNEAFVPKKNEPRGTYILRALDQHFRNDDAYTSDDEAIHICMQAVRGISYRQLRSDMDYLISIGKLVFEGSRLYLAKTKRYEDFAAKELAEILPNNNLDTETAKIEISGGVRLNELQQAAIQMACLHRISMILGGAGSGKTTLVNALTEKYFIEKACKKSGNTPAIKHLKSAIQEADTAIENLWKALETGQAVDLIMARITKRQQEKAAMEANLAIELSKQVNFTAAQVRAFLYALKHGDASDPAVRRGLINIFVNAIYLYDDKMTLILNTGRTSITVDNALLEEIDTRFAGTALSSAACSPFVSSAPPNTG